jgi:hypothetical protein
MNFLYLPGIVFVLAASVAEATDTPLAAAAGAVAAHRLAMPSPSTDFERWQADQWLFHARDCARVAGLPRSLALDRLPTYKAGSWQMPSDSVKACETLAQGPSPLCHSLSSRELPFTMPHSGLPPEYLFVAREAPLEGTRASVGGYCDLVANKAETRQFYAGTALVHWLKLPSPVAINTFQGKRVINAGTLEFLGDGVPGRHYTTVVLAP